MSAFCWQLMTVTSLAVSWPPSLHAIWFLEGLWLSLSLTREPSTQSSGSSMRSPNLFKSKYTDKETKKSYDAVKYSEFWTDKMNRENIVIVGAANLGSWVTVKMSRTHDVCYCLPRIWSCLVVRAVKFSFCFLQPFHKSAVNIPTAWVPPEKWTILMQVIEQMLSKELLSYSFNQWFVITMLSKYSVNEVSKAIMLRKQVVNWDTHAKKWINF